MAALAGLSRFGSWAILPFAEGFFQPYALRAGDVVTCSAESGGFHKWIRLGRMVCWGRIIKGSVNARVQDLPRLQRDASVALVVFSDTAVANDTGDTFHCDLRTVDVAEQSVFTKLRTDGRMAASAERADGAARAFLQR